ncbi:MAG: hypothetical protein AAGJ83_09555, partial [Planctomycetota bacterium]
MNDVEAFRSYEQLPDRRSQRLIAEATSELSKLILALRLPSDDDPRPMEEIEQSAFEAEAKARKAFEALERRLTERQGEAIGSKAEDARGLRQTFALLKGSGSSDVRDRKRLHNKLVEILRQTAPAVGSVRQDAVRDSSDSAKVSLEGVAWSVMDGTHVWDAWLSQTRSAERGFRPAQPSTPEIDVAMEEWVARFGKSGAELRNLIGDLTLGELDEGVAAAALLQVPVEKAARGEGLESIRRELAVWDAQIRARTFLFSHSPAVLRRVGEGRFSLDQQLFLYDHAERVMDEFWCQPRKEDLNTYFSTVASGLLTTRHHNPLFSKLKPTIGGSNLEAKLKVRNDLVKDDETLKPLPTPDDQSGTLLKFVAGKSIDFLIDQQEMLPRGFAAFWAINGDDSKAVSIDRSSDRLRVALRVPKDLPSEADAVESGLFFRGLRRRGSIPLNRLQGGTRTVFRLPRYDAPALRIDRDRIEPQRLLIVMDCSKSMVLYPKSGPIKRLDDAKDAVIQFLQNLQGGVQGQYEVGLVVFGDRYGFEERDGSVVVKDGRLQVVQRVGDRLINAGLLRGNEDVAHNPNLDVQLALPLNPLSKRQSDAMVEEIRSLGGIGTTPTSRALLEAYDHLGDRTGHIILLTDGTPRVITMPNAELEDATGAAQRVVDSRQNDVRLTIVKYQYKDTVLEDKFPTATVLTAATGPELLKHLESVRIEPEIRWERNRLPASEIGDFRQRVTASPWPPEGVGVLEGQPVLPAEPYSVRVKVPSFDRSINTTSDVAVSGGEEFALRFRQGRISHKPFDYKFASMTKINPRGADAGRYLVHVGQKIERRNRQLTVRLALERA